MLFTSFLNSGVLKPFADWAGGEQAGLKFYSGGIHSLKNGGVSTLLEFMVLLLAHT
jgi:hypothetical protein